MEKKKILNKEKKILFSLRKNSSKIDHEFRSDFFIIIEIAARRGFPVHGARMPKNIHGLRVNLPTTVKKLFVPPTVQRNERKSLSRSD